MKKLIKLAMLGLLLKGGRRSTRRMMNGYGPYDGYGDDIHGYRPGYHRPIGYGPMGYISYKAQKRMKRKMQKRMLKHALKRII